VYDAFYTRGGWKYRLPREWWWHWRNVVRRFKLKRGMGMLEIACGMGFHTDLFCRMGFDCSGMDICETAVRLARERYPNRTFHQADATGALPATAHSLDVVITRGCSLYHYDLSAPGPVAATENILGYLKPGGRFILIIASDLSGDRRPGQIWQNRLVDYREHFARFGQPFTVGWRKGMVICSLGGGGRRSLGRGRAGFSDGSAHRAGL